MPRIKVGQLDALPYEVVSVSGGFVVVTRVGGERILTRPYARSGMAQHEADRRNGAFWRGLLGK
jgi:hypothetical protein